MTGDDLGWTRLSSRPGPSGFVRVETATFRLPDGAESDWDLVTGPDVVAVLALTDDGEVVLARQFRPGPGRLLDELPGGIVDDGETPLEAAVRELAEETGYAGEVELAGSYWAAANWTRRNHVAVARRCRLAGPATPGPDEFVAVVTEPLAHFRRRLARGELTDLGAAFLALDHLGLL